MYCVGTLLPIAVFRKGVTEMIKKLVYIIETYISIPMLYIIFITILLQIFSRYVLRKPFLWTMELSQLCFAWLVFLGAIVSYRRNDMVRMEFIYKILSEKAKKILEFLYDLLFLIVTIILLPYSLKMVYRVSNEKMYTLPLSESYLYISVTFGLAIILLISYYKVILHLKDKK
jgi:TRAP-type C4-dicarboxylate transport system permease small subunit